MRARNFKNKATKEKENSNIVSDSYTTETDTLFDYVYGRGLTKYDDGYYESRRSIETVTNIDDYMSSSFFDERDPRNKSPGSKSENIYSRRYSNSPTRQKRRNQSPIEYDTHQEPRRKSRQKYRGLNRLESASEQNLVHRSLRSPRRNDHYIYDDLSYENYFEPAEKRKGERSLEHSKRERRFQEEVGRELNNREGRFQKSLKHQREYQVYAYENARPQDKVFMRKVIDSENSVLPSEIELKSHEYPVLAFKDLKDRNATNARGSDMVYVPVVVMNRSNKKCNQKASPVIRKPIPTDNNVEVYATNLGEKNYSETMGETNFKETLPRSHDKKSLIKPTLSLNKCSFLTTESRIESILNETDYGLKLTDSNFSPKSPTQNVQPPMPNPFGNNQKSIVYQVNVDVSGIENDSNRRSQTIPKHDNLFDDYPVTKDYIKVNGSEGRKRTNLETQGSVKPTRQSIKKGNRNPSVFVDVITNEKISRTISDGKDAARNKSNVKDSFPNRNQSLMQENSLDKNVAVENINTHEESPKRSMVEAKSGSLAIPFDITKEDGTDVRSTQGLRRLSSRLGGPDKQVLARQSTKENSVRQSFPWSRKSTVSHQSPVITVAKQSSISSARESQNFENLSTIQQKATSTPEAQTQPTITAKNTSMELRQSLLQTKKAVEASPNGPRKSKVSTEDKIPSKSPAGTQQNLASEGLEEFMKTVFDAEQTKEPPLMKASLGRNSEVVSARKSEITHLRKSQGFVESHKEQGVSSAENLASIVNFSYNLENTATPNRDSLNNSRGTTPHTDVKTDLKSLPKAEDSGKVAQPTEPPTESKTPESKKTKSIVDGPPQQKSEYDRKNSKWVSRLFKNKSRSEHDIKAAPSKSLISKQSRHSVAKEKKGNTKKEGSKSFLGILKRSKSSISNKSRTSSKEALPSEELQVTKNSAKKFEGAAKGEETKELEHPTPCQCATYLKMARECGHFFLGTTLHEQVMNMLEIIWRS